MGSPQRMQVGDAGVRLPAQVAYGEIAVAAYHQMAARSWSLGRALAP